MFKMIKERYSIADFINMYKRTSINLSPRYQRTGGIWKTADNQLLIDSIFNGIDLPKFYFHLFPKDDNGKYQYSVIDGKQRILAIVGFFDNEYPLSKKFRFWENDPSVDISGMYYKDIAENYPLIAGQFLQFGLDFTIIDSDDIDRIDSMFIRINKGVKVNPAEKRNAHGGKLITIIADECKINPYFTSTVTFKDSRKDYQELFLKIFILEMSGQITNLNDGYINKVLAARKRCAGNEVEIVKVVSAQLRRIADAFGAQEKLFKKNNVILYYWFLRNKDLRNYDVIQFVRDFEYNRLLTNDIKQNSDYQRFNELTRQGLYQKAKMEERLYILEQCFHKYISM